MAKFKIKLLDGPSVVAEGTLKVNESHFVPIVRRLVGESNNDAALRTMFDFERTINTHSRLRAHIELA